jgi:hypothetical protein
VTVLGWRSGTCLWDMLLLLLRLLLLLLYV